MRLMFVYYSFGDAGSAQDIHHFVEAGKELGHEVVIYGRPKPDSRFQFSLDGESADTLIFVFEWTTELHQGDRLDLISYRIYKDPEQFWRICDANLALLPEELTAEPGRRLLIPVPTI